MLHTTTDLSKATFLSKALDNTTASYKFYWLQAVFEHAVAGQRTVAFSEMVTSMICSAWYPASYFHLSFGATDQLNRAIELVQDRANLNWNSPQSEVREAVKELRSNEMSVRRTLDGLLKYVPYRLIRPFYDREVREYEVRLRQAGVKRPDSRTNEIIFEFNQTYPEKALYQIAPDRSSITISEDWIRYFRENRLVIRGWLDYRLTQYLQARNPSVPAIPNKLHAPVKRNLKKATAYWKSVLSLIQLRDIYSGFLLNETNFEHFGALSIDHFIPWSFVLHDEPWNLIPMFKNENSAKSDHLPDMDRYFNTFAQAQFTGLIAVKKHGLEQSHKSVLDSYRTLDPRLDEYDDADRSREEFQKTLLRTLRPLYQIALNQGYSIWEYRS